MGVKKDQTLAVKIAELAQNAGGRAYYVGGWVRDRILGLPGKDIDLELHGLEKARVLTLLSTLGTPMEMGRSFGIWQLRGSELDISLPRKDLGAGEPDPRCTPEDSARRRDLTCNALLQDVLTGEILDPFGGTEDIRSGILRHVDPVSFRRDPLRVLRCARFAARYHWKIAEETMALCREMDLRDLPRERVFGEIKKALLESDRPSEFFEQLRRMDQLSAWFPELKALIGVPQSTRHHAEGDVWNHTMLVLDAAKAYAGEVRDPVGFLLSAVTHDFGKAVTTEYTKGDYHAYGHEAAGLPLAEQFLKRLTGDRDLCRYVLNLTKLHMKPNVLAGSNASVKSSNRMFDEAMDPMALICLGLADGLGKLPRQDPEPNQAWLLDRLQVYREYMDRPFVQGKDLVEAGMEPGPQLGECLTLAHKLRLAGVDKPSALSQVLAMARKNHWI